MNRHNNTNPSLPITWYDASCTKCHRLSEFLRQVKTEHSDYFCKPVPPFGDMKAEFLVVGLAPGKHGANASGRPFTGDHAGLLLYQILHEYGFASSDVSESVNDGLTLMNCRITNAVKCLPPKNKPVGQEELNCNPFLKNEIAEPKLKVILVLGQLAHRAILRSLGYKLNQFKFAHNVEHLLDNGLILVNSYHCSRYNTQTRRLTKQMFNDVFIRIQSLLAK